MRRSMKKKALALIMSAAMAVSMAACGGSDSGQASSGADSSAEPSVSEAPASATPASSEEEGSQAATDGEPVVIRYGTHWVNDLDPNHVDDVTGEYTMGEAQRQAALVALQAVKDQYNVEIEFLQYPVDVQTDLMTSVLAGDPICDLALMWAGCEPNILRQNVLQDLTPYVEEGLFEGSEWNLQDSLFGGYYLLNNEMGMTYFPLIVNLTLLEQVPGLQDENGNTIYPMDLFEQGDWTWSKFQEYLETIKAYYANVEAPDGGVYEYVQAYETDHRYAALAAIHANGGGIFDGGLTADSDEAIEAVQYISDLMDLELLTDCGLYDDNYTPEWTRGGGDFGLGCTVFTDCPNWLIGWEAEQCAERGENIGIIPFPRPDDMAADDPNYMQSNNGGNSVGILKGVSEEKTRLAIQSYILYWNTYYEALGGVDSVADYQEKAALTDLANYGVDIYNETYGDSLIDCYTYILQHMNVNWAGKMGLWDKPMWETILGESLYGINGAASYDVAIKARIGELSARIDTIAAALQGDSINDTYAPTLTSEAAVLTAGTDSASVDWTQYFTAEDTVDGAIAFTADNITVSEELDLAKPGEYENAVKLEVSDSSGNSADTSITVTVYNADNTAAPTVEAAEELPVIELNTDTSGIDWTAYLASATDADGINVKNSVTADLSNLDTTTPGTYDVALTVTDYAGNTAEITVSVTVE